MKIKIFFVAALFFLHFLGMQAIALANQDMHCGEDSSVAYECCEVQAGFEKHPLFFPLVAGAFFPILPQGFFAAFSSQKNIGNIIFFDLPPPTVLIWKNAIMMRC